jgi:hypothetical protein
MSIPKVYTLSISGVKLDVVGPGGETYSRNCMKSLSDSVSESARGVRVSVVGNLYRGSTGVSDIHFNSLIIFIARKSASHFFQIDTTGESINMVTYY